MHMFILILNPAGCVEKARIPISCPGQKASDQENPTAMRKNSDTLFLTLIQLIQLCLSCLLHFLQDFYLNQNCNPSKNPQRYTVNSMNI